MFHLSAVGSSKENNVLLYSTCQSIRGLREGREGDCLPFLEWNVEILLWLVNVDFPRPKLCVLFSQTQYPTIDFKFHFPVQPQPGEKKSNQGHTGTSLLTDLGQQCQGQQQNNHR